MHFEKIANSDAKKLVVGSAGSNLVIALAAYGAVSMVEDAVVTTKLVIARRKQAKASAEKQDHAVS